MKKYETYVIGSAFRTEVLLIGIGGAQVNQ